MAPWSRASQIHCMTTGKHSATFDPTTSRQSASGMSVMGSSGQLQEAALNLVSNAIKYTPEGGTITISLREADGQGIFEVKDTGYGIPIEYQSSLFQPFYRVVTRETAPIKGTGLGLYLVKVIVTRHGGEVFFHSAGGQGSTFGFTLPARARGRETSGEDRTVTLDT